MKDKRSLLDNFETDYHIGDQFTIGYILKTIVKIRKDKDGFNEYLLNDGEWTSGRNIVFLSD